MKKVELSSLYEEILADQKEPLFIEHQGKMIGSYHPIKDANEIDKVWQRLDNALDKASSESGLDKETLINVLNPKNPFPFEQINEE